MRNLSIILLLVSAPKSVSKDGHGILQRDGLWCVQFIQNKAGCGTGRPVPARVSHKRVMLCLPGRGCDKKEKQLHFVGAIAHMLTACGCGAGAVDVRCNDAQ